MGHTDYSYGPAELGMSHWPLGIYRSSGSTQASTEILYLPTPQGPLPAAAEIDGQLYAIEADHLHTPWRLSNAQGQGVWQWITSGFGEVPASHGGNGFVLEGEGQGADPGQVHDTETGLHYDHHRYYDPYLTVGYAEADPIGLNGGWNRFSYVDGDPLGAVDPSGLVKWSGRYHARMYAPSFGGEWVDFDLISECVNGKRYRIKMRGIGPVASFGPIPVSETYGTITFDDRQPTLNPDYLEGTFMFYSYGVSIGKWSWSKGRSFARAGFGVAGNDDISFAEGFDIGVSGIRGWSKVLNRILENCPCQQ